MKTKALIFDLDGTLVDTLKDLNAVSNECLNKFNYPSLPLEDTRIFIGNGIKKLMERSLLKVKGDLNDLDLIYEMFIKEYQDKCLRYARVYDGIYELINYLKARNILLFVYTNKNDLVAKKMIKELFKDSFLEVYGDSALHERKPDPKCIEWILAKYNLKREETLYVGDSSVDCMTAHNAFIKCIGCIYGFTSELTLRNSNCDYLINNPMEIIEIIERRDSDE